MASLLSSNTLNFFYPQLDPVYPEYDAQEGLTKLVDAAKTFGTLFLQQSVSEFFVFGELEVFGQQSRKMHDRIVEEENILNNLTCPNL